MSARRVWPRRLGAGVVALVATLVAGFAFLDPQPATALAAVTPRDGATLHGAPAEVRLSFTGPLRRTRAHGTVAGADGAKVTRGEPRLDGNQVILTVRVAEPGGYLVAYHVVAADGTELSGQSRFRVVATNGRQPAASLPPRSDATGGHAHGSDDPLSLALALLDAFLIVVVAALILRRPRLRVAKSPCRRPLRWRPPAGRSR